MRNAMEIMNAIDKNADLAEGARKAAEVLAKIRTNLRETHDSLVLELREAIQHETDSHKIGRAQRILRAYLPVAQANIERQTT